ncbi:hypothetical protein [Paenibacillus oleatilyticus]|uniref:Phage ABA sandwich domain-containing protein n=1 Tax=Paenibacillus oleatilyticus TaxID=2594886 RepID=A0ABV4VCC5_9BACL
MNEQQIWDMKPGRQLDALVAKEMGWTNFSPVDPNCDHAVGVDGYRRNFALDPGDGKQKPFPLYSTDIYAAWEVESTIADIVDNNELRARYVVALMHIVGVEYGTPWSPDDIFTLIHASAADRCRAALLALRGGEQR